MTGLSRRSRGFESRRSRLYLQGFRTDSLRPAIPEPALIPRESRSERFEVPVECRRSRARRARVEVAVVLPDERWVGPSGRVRVAEGLGKLEVRARRDHQRRERVPQIIELKPREVGAPAGLVFAPAR
jgi:hypothetical protein